MTCGCSKSLRQRCSKALQRHWSTDSGGVDAVSVHTGVAALGETLLDVLAEVTLAMSFRLLHGALMMQHAPPHPTPVSPWAVAKGQPTRAHSEVGREGGELAPNDGFVVEARLAAVVDPVPDGCDFWHCDCDAGDGPRRGPRPDGVL